jgi:hypothetical protein
MFVLYSGENIYLNTCSFVPRERNLDDYIGVHFICHRNKLWILKTRLKNRVAFNVVLYLCSAGVRVLAELISYFD